MESGNLLGKWSDEMNSIKRELNMNQINPSYLSTKIYMAVKYYVHGERGTFHNLGPFCVRVFKL